MFRDYYTFWPEREERALLGGFYIAGSISEALNVIFPFEFIYLYLVMERPEWAVIPILAESTAVFLTELPTGVVADWWGRKLSTLTGDLLSAFSWVLIPLAASLKGPAQLLAVCACFMMGGIGQTLVSGAEEAWVVDNLVTAKRTDLVDKYFARIRSFGSLGGVVAGSLALVLLFVTKVNRKVLNILWYISATGQVIGVVISATISEYKANDEELKYPPEGLTFLNRMVQGLITILHIKPLFSFLLVILIISFSRSITKESFEISLITRGLDARGLAPLDILQNLFGMVAPLVGVALAKWIGTTRSLLYLVLIPVGMVCLFFLHPGLWMVVGLYLFFNIIDDLWGPVADARLHSLIPSSCRATVGSMVNQARELVTLVGLGIFTLLLGKHSAALRQATPDLMDAFSGGAMNVLKAPRGLFGLPIPDLALVLFTLFSLIAPPILMFNKYNTGQKEKI